MIVQQNEQAADIPKTFSYRNNFELYISSFLFAFSIDDVENYDLNTHENSKYLFYHFNDYVKAYGSHQRKIKHTRKMKDSVCTQEVEERSKQFLTEKIIHGAEFQNHYNTPIEKNPEMRETVESN